MTLCDSCGVKEGKVTVEYRDIEGYVTRSRLLCEGCKDLEDQFQQYRILARSFLTMQRTRQSLDKKVKLARHGVKEVLSSPAKWAKKEERKMKKEVYELLGEDHELVRWINNTALGETALLVYLGEINPTMPTVGRVWAYWALTPKGKRRSGQRVVGSPQLKGKAMFFATVCIMKRDSFYYPLFEAKRAYYRSQKDANGQPKYRPIVAHNKAIYWLAKLLVAHAWESLRKEHGLPINPHRLHIPRKPSPEATPPPEILEKLKTGQL